MSEDNKAGGAVSGAQHTPGPWEAHGSIIMPSPDKQKPDTMMAVAQVVNFDHERRAQVVIANARLIAAAPELLAALEYFVGRSSSDEFINISVSTDKIAAARAAIAKATGA